ncbi:sulfatase [Lacipirellula limnantheis]|uniref:Arylsulfatase n=1 Tax=Lacipirellula limnantheis TaxID=2528024 RepID=A0A517TZR3_9BACT|nr:sulfatase [Lacipirellula limnantheis]QDT73861.1 Arylsulfatase [Lacipirellula limnantheis]
MTHLVSRLRADAVIGALLTVTFAGSMPRDTAAANADAADGTPSRPNVLLSCVDDLKPVIGCYGDPLAVTPNIDRLAARGVRFDVAYCNQAVCSPSRNALLTGLRPQTLGIYDLPTNFRQARPDAVTLPQHFKNNGYRTEAFGKIFHVGHGNVNDKASWSTPHFRGRGDYVLPENRPEQGTREEALFTNVPAPQASRLPRGAAYESAEVADDSYADGQVAARAVERIAAAAETPDEPFFLSVGFVKPHLPFCAPKKYWDLYDPAKFGLAKLRQPPEGAPNFAATDWRELRNYKGGPQTGPVDDAMQRQLIHGYYAATSYTDAQIGKVLDAIQANGLDKNTIVILWGDHGWHLGDHGMWCKHTNYQQAARIPLIINLPSGARAGEASNELVESVDLYPTLCDLAGLDLPYELEGASLVPVLNDPQAHTDGVAIHVFPRGQRLGRAVRTDRYRLVEWKIPGAPPAEAIFELYDYQTDPEESRNLAADRPEVVAELRAILAKEPEAKPQIVAQQSAKQQQRRGQRKSRRPAAAAAS